MSTLTIHAATYTIEPFANLLGANLRGANLSYANLWNADLSDADLRGADLSGADLRGDKISSLLTVVKRQNDPYDFIAFRLEDGSVKILAGCRWFTVDAYREHVAAEYPITDKATETLQILDFIQLRAAS